MPFFKYGKIDVVLFTIDYMLFLYIKGINTSISIQLHKKIGEGRRLGVFFSYIFVFVRQENDQNFSGTNKKKSINPPKLSFCRCKIDNYILKA